MRSTVLIGALLATTLLLGGCGRVAPTSMPLEEAATTAKKATVDDASLADMGAGLPVGTLTMGDTPLGGALPAAPNSADLVVGGVNKAKSGFLWRKLTVKGQVTNKGQAALSGQVEIRFKKSGKVVQSEFKAIASLTPGQSFAFEQASSVAADDVEITTHAL